MGRLDGKVAVMTGCASGLGKQHAIRFAHEGARLAICDVLEEKLMETKHLCEKEGAEVVAVRCDVGVYDDLVSFVEKTVERFGTIDVLLNNAHKITAIRPFLEQGIEDLEIELRTSLYATWHMMKLCFSYMRDKPGYGASIINVASSAGVEGTAMYAAYACSKEAIRGLTRVVAREWGEYGIRVNTVCPGGWTDNVTDRLHEQSAKAREWVEHAFKNNAFRRIGDPYDDVSPAFVFLASDESHWITGENLQANGGTWIGA